MPDVPSPSFRRALELLRAAAPRLSAFAIAVALIVAVGWATSLLAANRVQAEPVAPQVAAPVREAPATTALAGARRAVLSVVAPLRVASRDLSGFSDPSLLAEIDAAVTAAEGALDGEPAAVLGAAEAHLAARSALVERIAVDAESRLAAASLAEAGPRQTALDAIAATRTARPLDLSTRFAPMRAAVEAAIANHDAVAAAQAEADDWDWDWDSTSEGTGSADEPGAGDDGSLPPTEAPTPPPSPTTAPTPTPTPGG